jgi:hypothetical protein
VLVAAVALGSSVLRHEPLDDIVTANPAFERLHLSAEDCKRLLASAAAQITALRAALAST